MGKDFKENWLLDAVSIYYRYIESLEVDIESNMWKYNEKRVNSH